MDQIAIIGNPNRRIQDEPLIKKSQELFSKSLYIPITELRIKSNGRMYHNKIDISGFHVLPIPTSQYSDVFLSVASSTAAYIPYTREGLMMFQRKVLGLPKLRKAGFSTIDIYNIISDVPLDNITSKIRFPAEVTIGEISTKVEDERHIRDMIKLRRPGQGILIKEFVDYPLVGCFVVGKDVIAVGIEKSEKEKLKGISIGSRLRDLAISAVSTLGSDYGFICLSGEKIVSMTLSPNFAAIEKAANKDIATRLLLHMKEKIPAPKEKTVLGKIAGVLRVRK
jgi:hypothetical protein